MHQTIQEWFRRPDTPFEKSSQLARTITVCQDAPFFGKSTQSVGVFLSAVWRGERRCSPRLLQSIDCAIQQAMSGTSSEIISRVIVSLHDAIDIVGSIPRKATTEKRIETIASFLADSKNRGVVQAIATFDLDLPEPVVEELLRLLEQSPTPLSDKTCIQLFGDLNEAKI